MEGAEEDIERSIAWFEQQSPRDERGLALRYQTKALILGRTGRFTEAQVAINQSVRLHIAVFGADHEWTKAAIDWQKSIHAGKCP